jgi:anti-sigma regulatory factor (Ser/Thr protein kinase)
VSPRADEAAARRRAARARSPSTASRRKSKPSLVFSFPSQTSLLALVRDLTKRMAELGGFDTATAEQIALAVDEAATNVIEHAYHGAADRVVELRFEHRGDELRIDVVDSGVMVDPRSMPRVDLERYRRERRTGGLGVHLMEKIMDSVTFRRSARRNVCCLIKRKSG